MQKNLESNVSPFNHSHNTESPFKENFKIFVFLKCSVFLSSQNVFLHHMLHFSSYKSFPTNSPCYLLDSSKAIVSGSANWHSLSAWICRRDTYFWEKMWQATQKSYKWQMLFKHVLPKEAAQLETLPEGRIDSPQTTWELLAWSSTVRGPSFYSPCPCAEAIQQTSCHYSAWWASKHWALRVKENHSPSLIVTSLSSWIIICLCCFFLSASSVFTLALSPPPLQVIEVFTGQTVRRNALLLFEVWYIMLLSASWHVSLDFAKLVHLKWHATMHDLSNNKSFTLGECCQLHCNYLNWGSKQDAKYQFRFKRIEVTINWNLKKFILL